MKAIREMARMARLVTRLGGCIALVGILAMRTVSAMARESVAADELRSVVPQWNVGDHWVVEEVQWNRLRAVPAPMRAVRWFYQVVAVVDVDDATCLVVERWPQPVDPAFPLQHAVYYFGLPDLQVVRKGEWYYVQGQLRGPVVTDYATEPGTPHVNPDGQWMPSFAALPDAGDARADVGPAVVTRQPVRQTQALITRQQLVGRSASLPETEALLMSAATPETGVEITITEGVDPLRSGLRRQTWAAGVPWFLYEQSEAGGQTVGESRLVSFGRAQEDNPVIPFEPLVASPLAPRSTGWTIVGTPAELTEQVTASPEPWTGCWWSFYDSDDYANLFDIGNGDQWKAMKAYDDYFHPGETWAWQWENHYHRETSPDRWWWGHCGAWAAASLMESKPAVARAPFNLGEMEGLLTECWYDHTLGYWYPSGAGVNDNIPMTPGEVWTALRDNIRGDMLGGVGRPLSMDLYSCASSPSGTDQVWNHPVFAYSVHCTLTDSNRYNGTITVTAESDAGAPIASAHDSFMVAYRFRDVVVNAGIVDPASGIWVSSGWTDDPDGNGVADYIYPDVAWYPAVRIGGNNVLEYPLIRGMIRIPPPSGLSLSTVAGTNRLVWVDNSPNETGFSVEWRVHGVSDWTPIATVGANVEVCSVPATSSSAAYRVRAYNEADGYSLYSNVSSANVAPITLTVDALATAGAIDPAGDVDAYVFTAVTAGAYMIETQTGTLNDTYMYLYGPNSSTTLLAEDDDSGIGYAARLVLTLVPGTYEVKVRAHSANQTGTYTIRVTLAPADSTALTVDGPRLTGNIAAAGDCDWYAFTVATSGSYTVDTQAGTLADNYLFLFGPDSRTALVAEDDDSGAGYAARIVQTLVPGTYFVKVRAHDAGGVGTYSIAVTSTLPEPIALTVNGATLTGAISPAGDVDWYVFTVATTGSHTIDTQAQTLADNYMYLYGPNSRTTLLAEDNNSGAGNAARIVRTLTAGTYYVKVRANVAADTGTYTIRVTRAAVTPVTLTVRAAAVTGTISPAGDEDWYVFSVRIPRTYRIETQAGSLTDNYMHLYGPNSQTALLAEDDNSGSGNAAKIVQRLTRGTYYIKVRAKSSGSTGTYTIWIR